jgi:hypothetical protein
MDIRRMVFSLVLAAAVCGLTLSIEGLVPDTGWVIAFCIPGMIGSMAVSNNVHAFHLWGAAIFNFIFYFLLTWGVIGLGSRLFKKKA